MLKPILEDRRTRMTIPGNIIKEDSHEIESAPVRMTAANHSKKSMLNNEAL